jgi:phosphonate transport system substrate-binding protein
MRRWTRSAAVATGLGCLCAVAASPVLADWRHDMKVLRIGFLSTGKPANDMARLEPFRAWLEGRIELPVELVPSSTWAGLIDAEASARVQYAIHSATSFATAEATCSCIEALAVPTAFDGSRGFHAVLLARADGPIHSLAEAKGARLALTGGDSLAGRLVPLKAFAAEGIDPATHFSATFAAPGPQAAIASLLSGEADVAVGWSSLAGDLASGYSFGVLTSMVADGALSMDQIRVIWQSRLIPFGPHAVRKDMPAELKPLLVDALEALAGEAPDILDAVDRSSFGGGGFVPAQAGDYAVVEELVTPDAPAPVQ